MSKKKDKVLLDRLDEQVYAIGKFFGQTQTWHITIKLDDLNKESSATRRCANTSWPRNYKKVTFTFDRDYVAQAESDTLTQTIVHEWLHVMFAPTEDVLQEQIGDSSYVWMHYSDQREGLIDQLAYLYLKARDGALHKGRIR